MLKEQVRDYDDTYSVWDCILEHVGFNGPVAQGTELPPSKRMVVGSNPTGTTS